MEFTLSFYRAAAHSITSSARAISVAGTAKPCALEFLKLPPGVGSPQERSAN
jgi:hypothetical protein